MISGQTSTIKLKADNIVWEGMITANGNVIICEDGSLECNKGKFNDNVSIKDKLSIHTQYKDLTAGYDVECLMDALSTTISQYGMSTKYLELLVGKPDNTVIYSGPNAPDLIAGGIRVKGMLTLDEEPFVISDMDAKDKFTDLDERYYNLAEEIHYLRFVYRYGRSGRYHVGIVAQDFEKLLEKHKIDTEELAILGIDGKGKRSIRYGELGNLMGWYAKERMNRQDTKIADLEERLLKLEERLGD